MEWVPLSRFSVLRQLFEEIVGADLHRTIAAASKPIGKLARVGHYFDRCPFLLFDLGEVSEGDVVQVGDAVASGRRSPMSASVLRR